MERFTRRKAFATAINAVASLALPSTAAAAVDPVGLPELPEGCTVVQVTGDSYAPAVRKSDYVIYREGEAKAGHRVLITMRNKDLVLAELVHRDPRTITARPLQPGARLQAIPAKSVKAMGRVVAFYSP